MNKTNFEKTVAGPDGCEWCFRLDAERRNVFLRRRLGETWSPEVCVGGIHHVLAYFDGSFGEELAPLAALDLASTPDGVQMVLHSPDAFFDPPLEHLLAPKSFVRPRGDGPGLSPETCEDYPLTVIRDINLPDLHVSSTLSVMFLDCLEVESVENLDWFAKTAEKHTGGPVLHADKPWESKTVNCVGGTVLFTDGKFRMWYNAVEPMGQSLTIPEAEWLPNWQKCCNVCYAESEDGLHWEKPVLGKVDYMGSTENNLVPSLWRGPTIVEDVSDPDSQRRFKCSQQLELDTFVPELVRLHTSPDGIEWETTAGHRHFGDSARPHFFVWNSVFIDEEEPDPEKRWKAYGYFGTSPNRRTCGAAWSPDGVNWTAVPENPIISPRQFGKWFLHDLVVWKENGLYLGLVQTSEMKADYDFALVFSRDGVHFSQVGNGLFLARGTPDEWDGGNIHAGCCMPVQKDGRNHFYYAGADATKETFAIGLATATCGQYAGFKMPADEGEGVLRTRPIALDAAMFRLELNAEGVGMGTVTCALMDPTSGACMPGYGHAKCLTEVRDHAVAVAWKTQPCLPSGRFRLEIRVHDPETRLYGFHIS